MEQSHQVNLIKISMRYDFPSVSVMTKYTCRKLLSLFQFKYISSPVLAHI
jgi:hypothetical protein